MAMDRVSHPAPSAVVLCRPSVADAAAMFLEANLRGGGKGREEGCREVYLVCFVKVVTVSD